MTEKKTAARTCLVSFICIGGVCLLLFWPKLLLAYDRYRLNHINQSALLSACRELIADHKRQLPPNEEWSFVPPSKWPREANDLHAKTIEVSTNAVHLGLRFGMGRFFLIAFAEGAEQYGRYELIDGLRYTTDWNSDLKEMLQRRKPQQTSAGDGKPVPEK